MSFQTSSSLLNLQKPKEQEKWLLKSLLSTKGQKRNRGAWKMNLFTYMVELWSYDSRNLCSKTGSFFKHLYGFSRLKVYKYILENVMIC